jgi:hypothetical protein
LFIDSTNPGKRESNPRISKIPPTDSTTATNSAVNAGNGRMRQVKTLRNLKKVMQFPPARLGKLSAPVQKHRREKW